MPTQGLALSFDTRYVTAAIDAWRVQDLAPITLPDLERRTAELLRERFIAWTVMGMREETVSQPGVVKALGVLTAVKLAKKTTRGSGESRVALLTPTAQGFEVLREEPVGGVLYPRFAECLWAASGTIHALLDLLHEHGPLHVPVLHLTPDAPRRGTHYQLTVKEGLDEFRKQITPVAHDLY